ncbi:MAG: hypothetical protein CMJ77_01750 [Planctomycetaceae bacterium]|nr:hypothetical protein [Planctomycetaceae bacterium]
MRLAVASANACGTWLSRLKSGITCLFQHLQIYRMDRSTSVLQSRFAERLFPGDRLLPISDPTQSTKRSRDGALQ